MALAVGLTPTEGLRHPPTTVRKNAHICRDERVDDVRHTAAIRSLRHRCGVELGIWFAVGATHLVSLR
jgi:hypothetical protein